jgi:hypothetical protein
MYLVIRLFIYVFFFSTITENNEPQPKGSVIERRGSEVSSGGTSAPPTAMLMVVLNMIS